jgi:uncharacterized membrane protein
MKKVPQQQIKELWQTTHLWLTSLGNKINLQYTREEITTHPDYPALTSVIDFLDSGAMAHKAVQADASCIHEFNYPLLALIRQPGHEYMHIIKNSGEWDDEKEITQRWTGIVVSPEKNASWQSDQNISYQRKELKNKIITSAYILAGIALFIISTFQLFNFSLNFSLAAGVFGLLSFFGLVVSLFALGTELGFQSQIVKQVCGTISNGGCEQVLKSSYAKGIAGITPADASVLYFAAQFAMYILGCSYPWFLQGVFLFAFGGIPVAAWSIYTQGVKLKQWCALCLGIVIILILQTIVVFTVLSFLNGVLPVFILIAMVIVLAFILLPIKQLIVINSINHLKAIELKKWKLDADLFIRQWQQEEQVDTAIWENDLLLGDSDAPLQITVACNPYCGPCAKGHKKLDDLLRRFADKLKVQIRFLCIPGNNSGKITLAVKAIFQKTSVSHTNTELQQMLSDWFEWMDFDKWNAKWKHKRSDDVDVECMIIRHDHWIKSNNITSTPTFFINGRKFPGKYSLNDIEILIPQLTELINEEMLSNK